MSGVRKRPWDEAEKHLVRADRRFAPLVDRHGPCKLRPYRDRFGMLVRSIVSQQISSKAAETISGRLEALTGKGFEPARLLGLGEDQVRACGLSGQKTRYVLGLAADVVEGRVRLHHLHKSDDETIIAELTKVKGIGRWTAEMFLIFSLNRPDVLPVDDLGIRNALRLFHGLEGAPTPKECPVLTEPWRPYRTVAMWYLWRLLEDEAEKAGAKQSKS